MKNRYRTLRRASSSVSVIFVAWIILSVVGTGALCEEESSFDLAELAARATRNAGSIAANASTSAAVTTAKTLSLVAVAIDSTAKTFKEIGAPFWRWATGSGRATPVEQPRVQKTDTLPAGYTPAERTVHCSHCGQQTLIRGDIPGLVITCPSCGQKLSLRAQRSNPVA